MKGLQSLVVLGLALAAMAPSHAQIKNADYPIPVVTQGTFNLAQAYPCTVSGYAGMGISNSQTWGGTCGVDPMTNGAAPGILSFRRTDSFRLDANCFAAVPAGQKATCFLQNHQLTKDVSGSLKCADICRTPHFDTRAKLSAYLYYHVGSGINPWRR